MSIDDRYHVIQGPLAERLATIRRLSFIVGILALAACLALGLIFGFQQFLKSYYIGFLFWLGLPLGCIGLLLLNHLASGTWGLLLRRPLEAGAATLPLLTVLFVPIALNIDQIYPWAGAEGPPGAHGDKHYAKGEVQEHEHVDEPDDRAMPRRLAFGAEAPPMGTADEIVKRGNKEIYFDLPFFFGRAIGFFVVWNLLAWILNRWSDQQDRTTDPAPSRRLSLLGAPGLILLFLTGSFAMFDWVMSLEPDWYSTIYGMMLITGMALQTFAFVIATTTLLADRGEMQGLPTPARFRDLGNLLLAFVMLWAYMNYSQFIIIWNGDLIEEIPWYLRRTSHGWQYVALALIVFHFFLPFFVLLFRGNKERTDRLRWVASAVFLMHLVDIFWLTAPALGYRDLGISLLDPLAVAGIGGLWLGVYTYVLGSKPLLSANDPALVELREHDQGNDHHHRHQEGPDDGRA
ncbi:hypothetical protein BH23PLA1_BH23PLA1_10860 [soil metagenome]